MIAGTSCTAGTNPSCCGGQDYDKHCGCDCSCGCAQAAVSDEPVRYFNGQKSLSVADLASGGLGAGWGHTRQYNNRLKDDDAPASFDMGQGFNWLIAEWPYARPNNDGSYLVARGTSVFFFEPIGGGQFSPWFGIHQKLEQDFADHLFRMTDPDGHVWELNDFEALEAPGIFRRLTTPGGQTVEVTAYDDNKISTVERASGGQAALERYQYEYLASGPNTGRLQSVTLQRRPDAASSWNDIRRVVYSYYQDSDTGGSLGDLQTAVEQTLVNSTWTDVQTHYYRYWKDAESSGFQHGLKYSVGPEAFSRLAADPQVADPLTAADSIVAQYADLYLEYDAEQRITQETVAGDSRTYSFIFEDRAGGFTHAYNHWFRKTTEVRPDGSETIVYSNHLGQVLLREFSDGEGGSWYEHWQLDEDEAHTVLHAHPSAIDSYTLDSQTNELSVSLKANDGLIEVSDYYTTSGNGAAEGHVQHEKIKQGTSGAEIKQRSYEYASHSNGGRTVNPISKQTVYRNEDGTGAIETSFSFTFHPGSVQIQERTTTLPAIPVEQNGSGLSNTRTERFDAEGNLIWSKDERGFITRHKYDPSSGALTQTIRDVDTAQMTDEPSGWSTPVGGGLHIVTDYQHDEQGRLVQELGPEHEVDIDGTATQVRTATWTVYDDVVPGLPTAAREVRSAHGYLDVGQASQPAFTLVNPVSITQYDAEGRTIEEIQAVRQPFQAVNDPLVQLSNLSVSQTDYVRWSTNSYSDDGQLEHTRVYHTIPSVAGSVPEPGLEGANYDQTNYGYDTMSRQNMVRSPGGTITRTVFSPVGWDRVPTAVFIGTDDTSATESDPTGNGAANNDMVLVSESQYDNGLSGGDGLLSKQTEHVDSSTKRETSFLYDWRGRQTDFDGEEDFCQVSTYDNLDRVTRVDRHDTTSTGNLIARTEASYDDLGRVYQTKRYAVDVSTGTVGNSLTDNTWYDEVGNVIKEKPAGSEAFTKYQYDSFDRQVKQFTGFDIDESSYADAFNVTGDTIFEQSETDYDDASNLIETRLRRRHHDAIGTGELTTPSGSDPNARVSYVALYSDTVGRQIATANYGTNGDSTLSRSSTIPTRSDDILVTSTEFNDNGEVYKTIDPADKEDRTEFDDAGRVTKQIENYTDGDPTTGGNDEDITVCFTYTADGQQATITAKQKSSSDDQTTKYIYGTSLSDSDIARTDLLRAVIYPDSDDTFTVGTGVPPVLSDGSDETYDRVEHKYNRQGQITETKDQNETVHAFNFDNLGRQIHDRVTTLGTNIDGAVRRISTTYEVRGQVERITSYDNATVGSGSVVNEVLREYNNYGLLDKEYQEHDGVKDANSLYVGYNYDELSSGGEFTKGLRPQSIRYPDGRLVHYTYGSSGSDADNLNRLDAIKDDNSGSPGETLASYTYLGLGQMVIEDLEEPEVKLDYFGGTSGTYTGFDRFDRIIDQRWHDYGANEDRDRFKYGYDRVGNRLWRQVPLAPNNVHDELYAHDALYRLGDFNRGALNAAKDAITTSKFGQQWSLDATGNWSNFKQDNDGNGTWNLDQARTVNKVNEITNISETAGPAWATPAYSRAGNMTTVPKTVDPTASFTAAFDAWNRLVKLTEEAKTVQENEYDGLRRRTVRKDYAAGSLDETQHFYYSQTWQVLEGRLGPSTSADRQFVWGLRYIDDCVLRDFDTTGDGTLNERLYALQDANWNVTAVTDTGGDVHERYAYQPYGQPLILAPDHTNLTASNFDWEILFAGYRWDQDIGLYQVRNRVLHPLTGTWLQRDALGYVDGVSLYCAYFVPSGTDPLGYEKEALAALPKGHEKWKCKPPRGRGGRGGYNLDRENYTVSINTCCQVRVRIIVKARRCFRPDTVETGDNVADAKNFYTEVFINTTITPLFGDCPDGSTTNTIACRVFPGRYISRLRTEFSKNMEWPSRDSDEMRDLDVIGEAACDAVRKSESK